MIYSPGAEWFLGRKDWTLVRTVLRWARATARPRLTPVGCFVQKMLVEAQLYGPLPEARQKDLHEMTISSVIGNNRL